MRRRVLAGAIVGAAAVLTTGGSIAHATTPGNNGLIVFAADDGSGFELYTIRADGSHLRQITDSDAGSVHPDWSPDGRRIVFQLEDESHAGIAIIDRRGTNLQQLTRQGFRGQPAFTPDGHHIVFDCDCKPQGIFIMRDDGSDRRRLTTHAFEFEPDTDPNVSPDGETVTFVRIKQSGLLQALFAVDIDGTHVRKLVPYRYEVAIKHDWAPDGDQIAITTNADYPRGRSPNVATVRPDGSDVRLLTHFDRPDAGAFTGSFSPNGRWIVFRVEHLDTETFRLVKMRPDGTHKTVIATLPFAPRHIDWGSRPGS